jgi:peptidoglycan hydrolase-like protein with peptidoglycan-binding domain
VLYAVRNEIVHVHRAPVLRFPGPEEQRDRPRANSDYAALPKAVNGGADVGRQSFNWELSLVFDPVGKLRPHLLCRRHSVATPTGSARQVLLRILSFADSSSGTDREEEMFLAGKAAYAGIVFLLLTTWISGPRPAALTAAADLSKEVPGGSHSSNINKMQQTLLNKEHYRGKVDGVFGLRTRASIRAYQKAENLPITGQLDGQTAGRRATCWIDRDEYLDQSTANKFRTPPLWGLRFRSGLMHDGNSPGTEAAINRHAEEATTVRQHYDHVTPAEKQQIRMFLNSLWAEPKDVIIAILSSPRVKSRWCCSMLLARGYCWIAPQDSCSEVRRGSHRLTFDVGPLSAALTALLLPGALGAESSPTAIAGPRARGAVWQSL